MIQAQFVGWVEDSLQVTCFGPQKRSCHLRRQHLQTWEINKSRPGQHLFQKRTSPQEHLEGHPTKHKHRLSDQKLGHSAVYRGWQATHLYRDSNETHYWFATTRILQGSPWTNQYHRIYTNFRIQGPTTLDDLWCDCDQFKNQSVFHWVMSWSPWFRWKWLPGGLHEVR